MASVATPETCLLEYGARCKLTKWMRNTAKAVLLAEHSHHRFKGTDGYIKR